MRSIEGATVKVISRSADGMRAEIVVIKDGGSTTMHVQRASRSERRYLNFDKNIDHMHFFALDEAA